MKLLVTGRRMTVSDATRSQIDRKLSRLDRLLGDSAVSAQCIIEREKNAYLCELTVHARGDHMLHANARHARLETAVTAVVQKLSQQAQRLKDRWKTRRKSGPARRAAGPAPEPVSVPAGPRVIRSRSRSVRPLTVDAAVVALQAGDQPFLVFRHADTGGIAIVHRRPDGHVGLIEPEA
jgi:putative sigma-54 modulation protein